MVELTREQLLRLQGVARFYQEKFDTAFMSWGLKAPAPAYADGIEAVDDYRRGQAVRAKKLLPFSDNRAAPGDMTFAQLRGTQYRKLPDDAYPIFEDQLLRAVAVAGRRNDSIGSNDPLRMIEEVGKNGERVIRWLGQRSFVHDFKATPRRVVSFTLDGQRFTSGRGWW
jgi:hypothetical protein